MGLTLVQMLLIDVCFVGVLALLLSQLARKRQASFAVLRRNFLAYFANPTGYVFLCVFVFLSSYAAFVPDEFFSSNLANLDQLNEYLPAIMLIFIPAITMSIWAEERRQGTDELLLTMPVDDFDIVLGKYLAAGAVFTASLLFSQVSNFLVLNALALGDVDAGLFAATYFGYWLVGMAMLSVGMIGSFLTSNLTIGFILGVILNSPWVLAMFSQSLISDSRWARLISQWSYESQFGDFGRGVISTSSVSFFVMVIVLGVYLSMILIGRRHWTGGEDGRSLLGHYIVRALALVAIVFGVSTLFSDRDILRFDATDAKISSLSNETRQLIKKLDVERPIYIDAFISSSLPDSYVKTKLDIISLLNEFQAIAGRDDIVIHLYDELEPFGDEAIRAEQEYDIKPVEVTSMVRGAFKQQEVLLAAAFTCGLEKVVVPFFDHGIPVEYEMVRSISTVAQQKRQKIGVVKTDADLFGGMRFTGMAPTNIPKQLIIEELEKQYEVVEIDPANPIVEKVDVLMAVQPSSLTQPHLDNLVDAVRSGIPTAIFEDPMPVALAGVPGTSQPKRPPQGGGMFGQQQQRPPEPKGNIQELWDLLGVQMHGEENVTSPNQDVYVIWQDYNPYIKVRGISHITRQWVFAGPDAPGSKDPMNPEVPAASNLNQVLFLFPGAVYGTKTQSGLTFQPMISTGDRTGWIRVQDMMEAQGNEGLRNFREGPIRKERYVLAARIHGRIKEDSSDDSASFGVPANEFGGKLIAATGEVPAGGEGSTEEAVSTGDGEVEGAGDAAVDEKESEEPADEGTEISAVFVADIDLLHSDFIRIRARPDSEVNWQFDNVTFVLNVLDMLADDDRFIEIRKRQTRHSTLKAIEEKIEDAIIKTNEAEIQFDEDFKAQQAEQRKETEEMIRDLQEAVDKIQETQTDGKQFNLAALQQARDRLAFERAVQERRRDTQIEKMRRDRDQQVKEIKRELDQQTLAAQNRFKWLAVTLPPIPPLIVGVIVFFYRRVREQEGVDKKRLK